MCNLDDAFHDRIYADNIEFFNSRNKMRRYTNENNIEYFPESELSTGTGKIGLKFIKKFGTKKSIIFSPLSLLSALYVLYIGSVGDTKDELKDFLSMDISKQNIKLLMDISKDFHKNNICENYILVNDNYELNPKYKMVASQLANINNENFGSGLVSKINNLVATKTRGLIKKIINNLDPNSAIIILNIVYFKENWKYKFEKSSTHENIFYSPNANKKVKFMTQTEKFKYFSDNGNQYLEMPYNSGLFSMGFILPKSKYLNTENISLEKLRFYINNASKCKVNVIIPKFEQSVEFDLVKMLKLFGVKSMFDDDSQDFHKMLSNNENMFVSQIIQKAIIKVDENGTEAAAVTAVVAMFNCVSEHEERTEIFNANHPFMFFIKHNSTNNIVFIGSYI